MTEADKQSVSLASSGARREVRLVGVLLLAGSVRPTRFLQAIGRSVLDLPVGDNKTVLDVWLDQGNRLATHLGLECLTLRILVNRKTHQPVVLRDDGRVKVIVENELKEYRGTAGLLHDACHDYRDDDYVLVGNAGQIMTDDLAILYEQLVEAGGDVCLVSHKDGTPSGLMLVRCGAVGQVSEVGYIDMKEQELPRLAESGKVVVLDREHPVGWPIRTLRSYIRALRYYHADHKDIVGCQECDSVDNPFREQWKRRFGLVEQGADVAMDARIHDSIILKGGRVSSGAVVVRSLVCGGAVVSTEKVVTDEIISSNGKNGGRK